MNLPFLLRLSEEEIIRFEKIKEFFSKKYGKQSMCSTIRLMIHFVYEQIYKI